jgi:hypothetical protein
MHLRFHDRQRTTFTQAGWCGAASTASVAFLSNVEVSRQLDKGPVSSVSVNGDCAWSRDLTFFYHSSRLCDIDRRKHDRNRGLLR